MTSTFLSLSRVFISFKAFLLYRSICIIDDGASRRRTRNSRFRARRADHSTTSRLTLSEKDRQNGEHRKGRVFIEGVELRCHAHWLSASLSASLSRLLVICQSQLGSFYKYSVFSVLFILTILSDECQTKSLVEWSARLARKIAFRVRRLLAPLSMMHILL